MVRLKYTRYINTPKQQNYYRKKKLFLSSYSRRGISSGNLLVALRPPQMQIQIRLPSSAAPAPLAALLKFP